MKTIKKILAVVFTLAFIVSMSATALAATVYTEAGKTVSVTFTIPANYATDGYINYSNRSLFTSVTYGVTTTHSGMVDQGTEKFFFYSNNKSQSTVVVVVNATVKSSAKAGDQCVIDFYYETGDENGNMPATPVYSAISNTVVIKSSDTTKTPDTTKKPVETSKAPTPDTTTAPVVTEPTPDTTDYPYTPVVPTPDGPGIDYTELLRQIAIAQGLDENEYTKDSWDKMAEALDKAIDLKTSNSQEDVDAGALALEKAIAALVKIDYSKLKKAIETAKGLEDCAHGPLWFKLFDALQACEKALTSRDQKAVDSAVADIEAIIEEIKKDCPNCGQENTKEIIKEVEVLPEGEYCNIEIHKLWPILFFISLAINLILGGLILWFFLKRKKNEKDDTPLVDYDIGDDE